MKVFLGGTCNGSTWRDELILMLNMDYFNPVVKDWTMACQAEEVKQREECDYCLYVITPKMTGVYSIAEAVDDSVKRGYKTIFCYLMQDGEATFTEAQRKSIHQTARMIRENGAYSCASLVEIAELLSALDVVARYAS